jgi:hypothetical protein
MEGIRTFASSLILWTFFRLEIKNIAQTRHNLILTTKLFKPYLPTSDCQCRQDFAETWKVNAELLQTNLAFLLYEFELWLWESGLSSLYNKHQ